MGKRSPHIGDCVCAMRSQTKVSADSAADGATDADDDADSIKEAGTGGTTILVI